MVGTDDFATRARQEEEDRREKGDPMHDPICTPVAPRGLPRQCGFDCHVDSGRIVVPMH